jgi:hypothetical protein
MVSPRSRADRHVCRALGSSEFASQLLCAAKDISLALHDQRRHSGADELRKAGRSLPPLLRPPVTRVGVRSPAVRI